MNLKRENYPCLCMLKGHSESASVRRTRLNEREPKMPGELNDDPFVSLYRCDKCGRFWIRILFEGYHTGSYTFYATHVELDVIEAFHMDLIDDIFLVIAGDKEQLVYRNIAPEAWKAWMKFSKPTAE